MLDRFQEQSGITVELVLTNEDQLPNLVTAAAAGGTLPDVLFLPTDFAIGWAEQGILDTAAATEVIQSLGEETFAAGALDLVRVGEEYAAVPSDGWGQILVYRADLFEQAGLEPPDTFERIRAAAEALNDPDNNFYGITASTDPGAVFTQQTFEHFALANNCQLADDSGAITLDSPECVEAIRFYTDLMRDFSPAGVQDVDTTRAAYFAGQAAMVVWSPFILDEMAGLRDDAFPACPECADNPAYLAENSGIVPTFTGPNATGAAQYGQVSNLGITTGADVEAVKTFLEFFFNDGYLDWLSLSPEGKFPMRAGTAENPTQFIEGWQQLETGVDRRAPLGEFYGEETIQAITEGAGRFQRWGFTQGKGTLVAALYESLAVPQALREVIDGNLTAEEAAAELQATAEELDTN
jgi:multiple sugar transport system substrate-binding protein